MGSRYRGLGILTPTQFDNFEIRNVVICQRRTQIILGDIYSSIVFSITTFIGHSYMFHCLSGIEGGGQETVTRAS